MEIVGVTITHPDKIMYPEAGITKGEVAEYYHYIAKHMLPLIKNRPLSLKHFPSGVAQDGFFHKHASQHYPKYIQRFAIPTAHHGVIDMIGVTSAAGLVYIAGQNTIEIHMSLARINNLRNPDQIIIDFDPSDDDFEKVRTLVLATKEILDAHGLDSFVKTTGSRGLHVHIPLKPKNDFATIKDTAKQLAAHIVSEYPKLATIEHRKNKRGKKVFIDYLRNDYSATAIAPYSLRANKWAGIATPISWAEVEDKSLQPYTYNLQNIRQRLESTDDPWIDFKA